MTLSGLDLTDGGATVGGEEGAWVAAGESAGDLEILLVEKLCDSQNTASGWQDDSREQFSWLSESIHASGVRKLLSFRFRESRLWLRCLESQRLEPLLAALQGFGSGGCGEAWNLMVWSEDAGRRQWKLVLILTFSSLPLQLRERPCCTCEAILWCSIGFVGGFAHISVSGSSTLISISTHMALSEGLGNDASTCNESGTGSRTELELSVYLLPWKVNVERLPWLRLLCPCASEHESFVCISKTVDCGELL